MASTSLRRQVSVTGNRQIFTISAWVKKTKNADTQNIFSQYIGSGSATTSTHFRVRFSTSDNLQVAAGGTDFLITNRLFRDTSSFYHVVVAVNTTLATADDRIKLYINGVQETSFATRNNPSLDLETVVNNSGSSQYPRVGADDSDGNGPYGFFDGVMSQVILIDGTAYAASTFGSTNTVSGEWIPNANPTVTYGTNGFKLTFEDTAALGDDTSGNTNDLTVLGSGTPTLDCPSNVFAVLNSVAQYGSNQGTLSNGNTSWVWSNYQVNARSTLGMPKGKFYWEQRCNVPSAGDEGSNRIGMCTSAFSNFIDTDSTDAHYNAIGNGGIYLMMSAASTSWQRTNNDTSKNVDTYTNATALATGDIIMNAVDVDTGKYWIGINGTWMYSGNPATGANAQITFTNSGGDDLQVFLGSGTNNSRSFSFNFGNGYYGTTAITTNSGNGYAGAEGASKFKYQPPTGYSAINTKGLNL